jgi:drug/metabolite transporter (DMT)-like permease
MALLGYLIFFSFAYTRLDAGSGALILIGAVQATMFGVAFFEGEHFRLSQWAGLGLALFGFVYLVLPGVSSPDPFGAVLMAFSGISWGCFTVLARDGRDPIEANAGNFLVCLLPTVIVNLLFGNPFGAALSGLLLAATSGAIATALATSPGTLPFATFPSPKLPRYSSRCRRLCRLAARPFCPSQSPSGC